MPEGQATELHVCFTPYHVFLATIIAMARRRLAHSRLALIEYRFDSTVLRDSLRNWAGSPFSSILSLKTIPWRLNELLVRFVSSDCAETIRVFAGARKNLALLARGVTESRPGRVYVYNDGYDVTQGAIHFAKRLNPQARGVYVEDGFAAYLHSWKDGESRKRRLFRRLFIGSPWFEPVRLIGTSRWIDECMVLFPHLRLPELMRYPCEGIPTAPLGEPEFMQWNRQNLECHGVPPASLANIGCVLAPPAAWGFENVPVWRKVIEIAVEEMRREGQRVALKYHPREYEEDYLGVASRADILVLPRGVSMEHVILEVLPHFKGMIGDVSSCLLTTKWLSPSSKVIACAGTTTHGFLPDMLPVLARAGCHVVNTEEELRQALRSAAPANRATAAAPTLTGPPPT